MAGQALLLPQDEVVIRIRVGAGCTLHLDDIGGTVAYGGADAGARWDTDIELAADARLAWAAKPFVVADGADVHRRTTARLGSGARLLLRETLVLGRYGERGGRLDARTLVAADGRPVLADGLSVDGAHPRPGVLGSHRVLDTVSVVGMRPPAQDDVLALAGTGAVARHFSSHAHGSPLDGLWSTWSDLWQAAERQRERV